jgi:carboxyl-terminal processing protease
MVKLLSALVALLVGFYVSLTWRSGDPGWALEFNTRPASAQGSETPADYDLKSLSVLNRAVIHIKENYVDPQRVDERRMIESALDEVQRAVPELLAETEKDASGGPKRVTVRIDAAEQTFDLTDVDNLWHMSFKFKDIFKFIQANLRHFDKFPEVEYAAINGMLSTLDPHSALLRPEDYQEMKASTRGKFGGLGIVVSLRDGHLTVVNPMPDTPATRAGVKAGDRIVQIGQDSTVNMVLQDAVDLLRGEPETPVDLWIVRSGWKSPRKFSLMRANIKVRSVDATLLADRVGWVRIKNFQSSTDTELGQALEDLAKTEPLRGLVLDLRDNPGGLLDQAIKVADRFVEKGAIVTTVGYGDKLREPKVATDTGDEPTYPLVVLVSGQSASASEIVAGALKNHKRALLVGQRTFGKGSVQVIYDNARDGSALKLTIAQYLTPGDVSIQSVGVVPDVGVEAVTITQDAVNLHNVEVERSGEKELPAHLDHASSEISKRAKPEFILQHLEDPELTRKVEESPNALVPDFEVGLARELVAATALGHADRDAMLVDALPLLERRRAELTQAIESALSARGVDWRPIPPEVRGRPQLDVTLEAQPTAERVVAGSKLTVTARVKNTGDATARRLWGVTRSEHDVFDGLELVFGNVPPGQSRVWSTTVEVPHSTATRRDPIRLELRHDDSQALPAPTLAVAVSALPRPRFALGWTVDDREGGNGDGLVQRGEEVELVLDLQNTGDGPSAKAVATLNHGENDEVRAVFLQRGRVEVEGLTPGTRKQVRFAFRVKEDLVALDVPLTLSVTDTDLRESTSERAVLRVVEVGAPLQLGKQRLVPRGGLEIALRGLYQDAAPLVAAAKTFVRADARYGAWWRVPRIEGGYAWVSAAEVDAGPDSAGSPLLEPAVLQAPPVITLAEKSPLTDVKDATLTLSGEALGQRVVRDLLIFVNNRKVFFKSNAGATDADRGRLKFSARVPLESGVNRITVVAREDDDMASRQTLYVNRAP